MGFHPGFQFISWDMLCIDQLRMISSITKEFCTFHKEMERVKKNGRGLIEEMKIDLKNHAVYSVINRTCYTHSALCTTKIKDFENLEGFEVLKEGDDLNK